MARIKVLALLGIAGFLAYANTFTGTFNFDDEIYIVTNALIRPPLSLEALWHFYPTRIITFLTLAANYSVGGLAVIGYHIVNLVVHVATAYLVWCLARQIFATPALKAYCFGRFSSGIALGAALIFLVHPVQTEAVSYVWQRTTSLATFFYVVSLYLYGASRLSGDAGRWRRILLYGGSWFAACLGLFTKESVVTLPLVIILYEYFFFYGVFRRRMRLSVPFLVLVPVIPLVLLLVQPQITFTEVRLFFHEPTSGMQYLLIQLRVFFTYLRLLVLPLGQTIEYAYPAIRDIGVLRMALCAFGIGTFIAGASYLFRRDRLLSFAMFFFIITLMPDSTLIPQPDVIYEHRLYLPIVGYALALPVILLYLFRSRPLIAGILTGMIIVGYGIATFERNRVWGDDLALWSDAVIRAPTKARPYYNRGFAYQKRGALNQAIADYHAALTIDRSFYRAYNGRGNAYRLRGDLRRALADYTTVIVMNPAYAEAYYNRAVVYYLMGEYKQSAADARRALALGYKVYVPFLEELERCERSYREERR